MKNILNRYLFAFSVLLLPAVCYCNPLGYIFGSSESWKEEVQLHDGRVIVVDRHVNLSARGIDVGRQELDETVTFTLPNSKREITWKSDFRIFADDPFGLLGIQILDIVDGIPYIAARPAGCIGFNKWKRPNPPYIFFKFDGKVWERIGLAEFPEVLNKTNVMLSVPPAELLKPIYSVAQVNELNMEGVRAEGSRTIIRKPFAIIESRCMDMVRTKDGWASPEGIKVDLPLPKEVPLEIVKSINYTPDRVISSNEWGTIFFDNNRVANCSALFKPADPYDPMKAGERFVMDTTGQKVVPYSQNDLHTGAKRICDQGNILFITHLELPKEMVFTKYAATGDLIYRISFRKPNELIGYTGYPAFPTIKSKNGFLTFEWWNFHQIGTDWHVARILKVRFHEPVSTGQD